MNRTIEPPGNQSQRGIVIARGEWKSRQKCPDRENGRAHFFKDISSRKPADQKDLAAGVRLITSQCKFCGCLIVDCPTINL